MGCGSNTTTQTSQPNPVAMQGYQEALNAAQNVAQQPLQQYSGPLVAGFTPDQQQAMGTIANAQGMAQPYINQAQQYMQAGASPIQSMQPGYNPDALSQRGGIALDYAGSEAQQMVGQASGYQNFAQSMANQIPGQTAGYTGAAEGISNQLQANTSGYQSGMANIGNQMPGAVAGGSNLAQGIAGGLQGQASGYQNFAQGTAAGLQGNMQPYQNAVSNTAQGMQQNAGAAQGAIANTASGLQGNMQPYQGFVQGTANNVQGNIQPYQNAMAGTAQGIQQNAQPYQNMAGNVAANMQGNMQGYQNQVSNTAQGIQSNMQPYQNMVGQTAQNIQGQVQPYQQQGTNYDVQKYESPYTQAVTNSLQNLFNQQNATQLAQVKGNAASQNALGGDREAVAEALTAQQQQLAEAPQLAQTLQQGFQQAQTEANAQQGLALNAGQLGLSAGQTAGQLGAQAGQMGLNAGQAAGQLQSQAGQMGLNAGQAAGQLGLGAGQLGVGAGQAAGQLQGQAGQLGLGASQTAGQLGATAGQMGLSAGQATGQLQAQAGQLGVSAGQASGQLQSQAGQMGLGAGQAAGQLGLGAGQLGLGAGQAAGQLGLGAGQLNLAGLQGQLGAYGQAGQLGVGSAQTAGNINQQAGQLNLAGLQGAAQTSLGAGQLGTSTAAAATGAANQAGNIDLSNWNALNQAQIGAQEATGWLQQGAGYGLANLGQAAQNTAIQGANAQLQSGTLQQQLAQENLNIPYEQFQAQQAYPYQGAGWFSNIAEGLGAGLGGTSSTTSPGPSAISQVAGLGTAGAGLIGAANDAGWFGGGGDYGGGGNRGGRITRSFGGGSGLGSTPADVLPPSIMMDSGPQATGATHKVSNSNGVPDVEITTIPIGNQSVSAAATAANKQQNGMNGMQPTTSVTQKSDPGILGFLGPLASIGKLVAPIFAADGGSIPHRGDAGPITHQGVQAANLATDAPVKAGPKAFNDTLPVQDFQPTYNAQQYPTGMSVVPGNMATPNSGQVGTPMAGPLSINQNMGVYQRGGNNNNSGGGNNNNNNNNSQNNTGTTDQNLYASLLFHTNYASLSSDQQNQVNAATNAGGGQSQAFSTPGGDSGGGHTGGRITRDIGGGLSNITLPDLDLGADSTQMGQRRPPKMSLGYIPDYKPANTRGGVGIPQPPHPVQQDQKPPDLGGLSKIGDLFKKKDNGFSSGSSDDTSSAEGYGGGHDFTPSEQAGQSAADGGAVWPTDLGRQGYAYGGSQDIGSEEADSSATAGQNTSNMGKPYQGLIQQYLSLPLEQLQEMAQRAQGAGGGGSSSQMQAIQQALRIKKMNPAGYENQQTQQATLGASPYNALSPSVAGFGEPALSGQGMHLGGYAHLDTGGTAGTDAVDSDKPAWTNDVNVDKPAPFVNISTDSIRDAPPSDSRSGASITDVENPTVKPTDLGATPPKPPADDTSGLGGPSSDLGKPPSDAAPADRPYHYGYEEMPKPTGHLPDPSTLTGRATQGPVGEGAGVVGSGYNPTSPESRSDLSRLQGMGLYGTGAPPTIYPDTGVTKPPLPDIHGTGLAAPPEVGTAGNKPLMPAPISEAVNTAMEFPEAKAAGLTKGNIAGIVGSMMPESGNSLNPNASYNEKNGTTSRGVAQWDPYRYAAGQRWAEQNGLQWEGNRQTQIKYAIHEYLTDQSPQMVQARRMMQAAGDDPAKSALAWANFERGAGWTMQHPENMIGMDQRTANAVGIYGALTKGTPFTPAGGGGGGAGGGGSSGSTGSGAPSGDEGAVAETGKANLGTTPSTVTSRINDMLDKLQHQTPQQRQHTLGANPWLALIAAGLGMMASRSPFPGVAIGEGGLAGVKVAQEQEAQQAKEETARNESDNRSAMLQATLLGHMQTAEYEAKKLDLDAKKLAQDGQQQAAVAKHYDAEDARAAASAASEAAHRIADEKLRQNQIDMERQWHTDQNQSSRYIWQPYSRQDPNDETKQEHGMVRLSTKGDETPQYYPGTSIGKGLATGFAEKAMAGLMQSPENQGKTYAQIYAELKNPNADSNSKRLIESSVHNQAIAAAKAELGESFSIQDQATRNSIQHYEDYFRGEFDKYLTKPTAVPTAAPAPAPVPAAAPAGNANAGWTPQAANQYDMLVTSLKQNPSPDRQQAFDHLYGQGASKRILGQ